LAYNVGNEVITTPNGTAAAAFIKAAARDVKAYLWVAQVRFATLPYLIFHHRTSKGSSALIGYAAIDGADNWVDPLANYLSCDPSNANSGSTSIDLFGLNN
jgi:1,3-beta-glucanosyltransferase GAS1